MFQRALFLYSKYGNRESMQRKIIHLINFIQKPEIKNLKACFDSKCENSKFKKFRHALIPIVKV